MSSNSIGPHIPKATPSFTQEPDTQSVDSSATHEARGSEPPPPPPNPDQLLQDAPPTSDKPVIAELSLPTNPTRSFADRRAVLVSDLVRALSMHQKPNASASKLLYGMAAHALKLTGGNRNKAADLLNAAVTEVNHNPLIDPPHISFSKDEVEIAVDNLAASPADQQAHLTGIDFDAIAQDLLDIKGPPTGQLHEDSIEIDNAVGFIQDVKQATDIITRSSTAIEHTLSTGQGPMQVDRLVIGAGISGSQHSALQEGLNDTNVTDGLPAMITLGQVGFYNKDTFRFGQTPVLNEPPQNRSYDLGAKRFETTQRINGRTFGDAATINLGTAISRSNGSKGALQRTITGQIEARSDNAAPAWEGGEGFNYRVKVALGNNEERYVYARHVDVATGAGMGRYPTNIDEIAPTRQQLQDGGLLMTGEQYLKTPVDPKSVHGFGDGVIVIGGGIIGFNAVEHATAQKAQGYATWVTRSDYEKATGVGTYVQPYMDTLSNRTTQDVDDPGLHTLRASVINIEANPNGPGVRVTLRSVPANDSEEPVESVITGSKVVYAMGLQPSPQQREMVEHLPGHWAVKYDATETRPLALENGDVRIVGPTMQMLADQLLTDQQDKDTYKQRMSAHQGSVPRNGSANVGATIWGGNIALDHGQPDGRPNVMTRAELIQHFTTENVPRQEVEAAADAIILTRTSRPNGFDNRHDFESWFDEQPFNPALRAKLAGLHFHEKQDYGL